MHNCKRGEPLPLLHCLAGGPRIPDYPPPEDLDAFFEALRSRDTEVRLAAIAALGQSGAAEAVPALARLLGNRRQFRVRDAAAGALLQLAHPDAVGPLRAALHAQLDAARPGGVLEDGRRAALALGAIGTPEAVEVLVSVLRRLPVPSAWSGVLQGATLEALAGIEGPAATSGLVELLDVGASLYRGRALERLTQRGWRPSTPSQQVAASLAAQDLESMVQQLPALFEALRARFHEGPAGDRPTLATVFRRGGDRRLADLAVRFLFEEEPRLPSGPALDARAGEWAGLLGGYADLAVRAALAYDHVVVEETTSTTRWENSLAPSDAAVASLAALDTPVSSNLLRLVLAKRPLRATTDESEWGGGDEELDLEPQRAVARAALAERGDPAYDPEAYLAPGAMQGP